MNYSFIGENVNHVQRHGESGLHILYRATAGEAIHDAADSFPQPKCHPETRKKMLDILWNWSSGTEPPKRRIFADESNGLSSDNPSSPILWLNGPAGAGKSAIAQSLCQKLEEEHRLGASFFFKRGHPSRGHAKRLFATIAYQLALHLPDLNGHISQSIENDPSLVDKSLSVQLQRLIIKPCQQMDSSPSLVIVIDGLDECDDPNIQQHVLWLIGFAFHDQQLPLRFLVTSRPEPDIREMFSGALNGIHCPVNVEQSFQDIRKYLLDEFARIHRDHKTMVMVPYPWPSQEIIEDLIRKSSGYFIFASTVVRFIDNKNSRPTECLKVITGIQEPDSGSPFAALDLLYTEILSRVPDRHQVQVLKILTVMVGLSLRPSRIEQLLELEAGDVRLAFRGLHSVINIPEEPEEVDNEFVFHHASFHDFLQDPARAGSFYVGTPSLQTDLCCHILRAISYMYNDPPMNRQDHVSSDLSVNALKCIASSEPTPGLITLLHAFNPDFLFYNTESSSREIANVILDWLKQDRPIPKDLIQVWEDYDFMLYCELAWKLETEIEVTAEDWDQSHKILLQASPSLIRILQAVFLIQPPPTDHDIYPEVMHTKETFLCKIHMMLNISWGELRTVLCSLRPLIHGGEQLIKTMLIVALDPTLFPPCFDSILWALACGSLNAIQQLLSSEIDNRIMWRFEGWSFHLRLCPPSPELLQDLCVVEPVFMEAITWRPHDYYNIVQWLKAFPQHPLELISRFEGYYLKQATDWDVEDLEDHWRDWKEGQKRYLNLVKRCGKGKNST
ncbi:hypothetical protein B0H14DRAFT_497334 [Mycena olivaceomarginata]|nr:hypothetical protein B0H14DRAFT_497334 [Mycena olivaceomarginata]